MLKKLLALQFNEVNLIIVLHVLIVLRIVETVTSLIVITLDGH